MVSYQLTPTAGHGVFVVYSSRFTVMCLSEECMMTRMNWTHGGVPLPEPRDKREPLGRGRKTPISSKPLDSSRCRWVRYRGGYAICGPVALVKPGQTVEVWNKRRRTTTKVKIAKVLSSGGFGETLGFPGKSPPVRSEWSSGPPAETLEEWKARQTVV